MSRKIFQNIGTKVGAILLALLVWFHVATEKVYEVDYWVPLTVAHLPPDLTLVEPPPREVKIKIRAKGINLIGFYFKKLEIAADLEGVKEGRLEYRLSPKDVHTSSGELSGVVEIVSPRSLKLRIDKYVSKKVRVISRVEAKPAPGYIQIGRITLTPSQVVVSGPSREVRRISSVETERLELLEVKTPLSQVVKVLSPLPNLEVLPPSVSIFADIQREVTRQINGVPVVLSHSPSGKGVKPALVDLTVVGGEKFIEGLKKEDIKATVDYRQIWIKGKENLTAKVLLPPKVRLVKMSPEKFKVVSGNEGAGD